MIDLEYEILNLILSLYSNPVMPRNVVQFFIDKIIHFTNEIYATYLREQVLLKFSRYDDKLVGAIQEVLNSSKIIFNKFGTEYQRFLAYKERDLLIMPINNVIGVTIPKKVVDYEDSPAVIENVNAQYIPLKSTLKLLLELPGIFDLIMDYMSELKAEKNIISNFIQAQFWNEASQSFGNKIVMPLFVYEDEFETGNALGSHGGINKLGVVYTMLPCLPPQLASHLDNILLTSLFYAKDHKLFGNKRIFAKLIAELNELSHDGITLQINNKTYQIYFQLGLILGDNLGLNTMLGFVDNFNFGSPCRICRANISEIKTLTEEKKELLRTVENYETDCNAKTPTITGIKEPCVFNGVKGYHVCNNLILDLMHDVFEGTANYTMVNICNDLIFKEKLFSLEFLNQRLQKFDFAQGDISNAVPSIKKEHIVTKKKLKMSSGEMICFTRYFGLIIGDQIKEDNATYQLYILFRKIVAIVTSPRIHEGLILNLEILIQDFLSLYKSMYGDLKYKFHNMTHLPRLLRKNGPLVNYWAMRPESKHRQIKLSSVTTSNKINLLKSLSIKSQLRLAFLKNQKQTPTDIMFDVSLDIPQFTRQKLFPNVDEKEKILSVSHAELSGMKYSINKIFVTVLGDIDNVSFGKIVQIFIKTNEVFLLMQPYISLYFDEHFYAYKVQEYGLCKLKNAKELPEIHPCVMVKIKNELFVASKYKL